MLARLSLLGLLALMAAELGCAGMSGMAPPASPDEYRAMQASWRTSYPRQTVLLYNLQRVLDRDLDASRRVASMKVVAELGGEDPLVLEQLAGVLGESSTPPPLRDEVLTFLLSKDYPELAQYVVKVLPHVRGSQKLRDVLLDWLVRHPTAATLSEIVKTWAEVPPGNVAEETNFRQVVERLTNQPWDKALVEAMNSPGFAARGSALEVLTARLPPAVLRRAILDTTARTEAMTVLQTCINRFDYLPTAGQELLSAASVFRARSDMLPQAAELAAKWRREYGYRFNIRDFHLLSRLAADPRKAAVSRDQLVADLSRNLLRRRHIRYAVVPLSQEDQSTRFDKLADRLTMVDLWNLWLLDEMISRSNIQAAIAMLAEEDRQNAHRTSGGLVFLEGGQALARVYPVDRQLAASDLSYVPSSRLLSDGRDALGRFVGHFETLRNANRSGPTAEEVAGARKGNYYLLVWTSLSETAFCAHYCNPQGVVVSLGQFPFAR
jgi:hypothetical protein